MTTRIATLLGTAAALAAGPALAQTHEWGERNTDLEPAYEEQFRAELVDSDVTLERETIAGDLTHPWGIAVLPEDQGYLVTERSGQMRHIGQDGTVSEPIAGVPEVLAEEQGGLLDVTLGPDFEESRMVYWTYAKPLGDGMSATAAARGVLSEVMTELTEVADIFVQEPPSPSPMHYGSRIVFDGDGHAFITTGEHFTEEERVYAQDLDKTYGKVVRVNLDGSTPEDNPFVGNEDAIDTIWSYGHRNVQGAFYDEEADRLFTIEHGPEGGDEFQAPEAGLNYGWPEVSYGQQYGGGEVGTGEPAMDGVEQPLYFWDPVIAPAGMLKYDGDMFADWDGDILVSSLYPGGIVRLGFDGEYVTEEERLMTDLGRVRDIATDHDGSLLVVTDEAEGDLIRITTAESD